MSYESLTTGPDCDQHFRMEDAGSVAIDSSPRGANGSYSGTSSADGVFGQGRSLDGGILIAPSAMGSVTDGATIAMWVRWASSATWRTAAREFTSSSGPHPIIFNAASPHELGGFTGGAFQGCGWSPSFAVGEWFHVAATSNSSSLTSYYINGQLVGTAATVDWRGVTNGLALGCNWNGTQPVGDRIDDAVVLSKAASPAEIGDLYAGPTSSAPTFTDSLLSPLTEGILS